MDLTSLYYFSELAKDLNMTKKDMAWSYSTSLTKVP